MKFSLFSGSSYRISFCLPVLLIFLSLAVQPAGALAAQPQGLLDEAEQLLDDGNLSAARDKYSAATRSTDRPTRLAGFIGLGRVYRQMPGKRMESLRQLKKASKVDPANTDVLYEIALTGFELGESSGAVIADNALTKLICQDPAYRDAYSIWHEKIRGRSQKNIKKAANCLPGHIALHPELSYIWLDIAFDWFKLFNTENCLAALDSLLKHAPEYKPQERFLLRARCLMDMDDIPGFEAYYRQALKAAESEGDFKRLITEAETIFTPDEAGSLQSLESTEQVATFLGVFWRNKDFDPVTLHNERLVEHYQRLRTAERAYRILTPDGLVNNSDNYLRLVSMPGSTAPVFSEYGSTRGPVLYDYDPLRVFGGRGINLGLDHRGLLYLRHGPPDEIDRVFINETRDGFSLSTTSNAEQWIYNQQKIVFKEGFGTGGYLFWPAIYETFYGIADIEHALNTQTYEDPLPEKPQDYYSAAFLREDGRLDLEFYQSVKVKDSQIAQPPEAKVALYDRSLNELARDSSVSVAAPSPDGDLWLAINSLPVDPEDYSFGLSMALPDVRSAVKSNLHVEPISGQDLALSGIVMGVQPGEDQGVYGRGTVKILPRPSLEFGLDELIETFMEVYNLNPDSDSGREYEVRASVTLIEQDRSRIGKLMEKFRLLGQERGTELTMTFERVSTAESEVVAEHFTINASELIPGLYRLEIEVRDRRNNSRASSVRNFRLVE